MTGTSSCQPNMQRSAGFSKLTCFWLIFFVLTAIAPVVTTSWLIDVLASTVLCVPAQHSEHLATTPQQSVAEAEASEDVLFFVPTPYPVQGGVVAIIVTVVFFFRLFTFFDYWRVPACPRPPPYFSHI